MSASPESAAPTSPASMLRSVRVGLREDLDITRHLFRSEPSYIVRDPMTFQSQRLTLADYEIFVRIDPTRPLSEVFDELVGAGKTSREDEDRFYRFVMSLHALGFLHLPIADSKLLYRRYRMREQAKRREKLLGFLFLRIPLWNPDTFLERTMHLVRPIFGPFFLVSWLLVVASAGYVAAKHWDDLSQPFQGLLVAGNLPLMWVTLVALKLVHELGHAYACKHYGGHVPEMGIFLVVFTPCAYMDASASWGFVRKRERIIVCLAGVCVEGLIAALAVFVWAATEAPLLKALAFNVIFLASVVTVLFNINPLLRYDGYYILSDLTEVPNLRQRSNRYLLARIKRLLLGLEPAPEPGGLRLRAILFTYGIAATLYRVFLLLAIAAILVSKMLLLGVLLGVLFLGGLVLRNVHRLTRYLWYAEEAAPKRRRAVTLSLVVLTLIPAALVVVPVPGHVKAPALVSREHETVVRAKTPGFLEEVQVESGQVVRPGEPLARLANDYILEEIAYAEANLKASRIRRDAHRVDEPVRALQEQAEARAHRRLLDDARQRLTDLNIRAPRVGQVVECVRDSDIGSFLLEGSPVVTLVAGSWNVRAVLTDQQLARVQPCVGDKVAFRATALPSRTLEGVIVRVDPAGSRDVELEPLTQLAGGDIAVDPQTKQAPQPYFHVTIELPGHSGELTAMGGRPVHLRHGMTGTLRLATNAEPVAKSLGRRFMRFWNRLLQG